MPICLLTIDATDFPFPLSVVRETTTQSMPEQTPYLFCTTHEAQLWAVCSVSLWEHIDKKTRWSFSGLVSSLFTCHGSPSFMFGMFQNATL